MRSREEDIFDDYWGRIFFYSFKLIANEDSASDIAINAFKSLFATSYNLFDEDQIFRFLYDYAEKSCKDYMISTFGVDSNDPANYFYFKLDAELVYRLYKELKTRKSKDQ
jgi:hypothetical protein